MENYKAKFLCSYGGNVQPRTHGNNHRSYVGGHTKILFVDRTINFTAMLANLSALCDAPAVFSFKYQLPGEDLDTLISVTNDDDLHNMMLEYDRLHSASAASARMLLFLFPDNNPPDRNANHLLEVQTERQFQRRQLSPGEKYDVFISFRGEDTRTNFTCHLHEALTQKQIKTFMDYELHKGDEITPSLVKAIKGSYVSVVVFSENYAQSHGCLQELVQILESRRENGQVVVPVFYDVDPSHVRKQVGSYKEALEKHVRDFKHDLNKVQKWKDALTEAASLAGWDSKSRSCRDNSKLIQEIVKDVLQKLNYHHPPNVFKRLVGISKNCAPLELLLREAHSIGIWGMGGIGKTTIARDVFDKYSGEYEGSCFLENVREKSGKRGQGLHDLRNQLYSELLGKNIRQNSTTNSTFDECRLQRQRNLIVLDDVTSSEQLKYLIGAFQPYGLGSRIIITTRDKSVLESTGVEKIHKMEELDFQESLTLFSWNAFNAGYPHMRYKELSRRAVVYCKGVPLALIVLGSFLHSKSENEWDSALKKLEKIPKEEIQNVLKLSYDGLDDKEKEIFLDLACFFKGEKKEYVITLLDSCGFYAVIGMRSLHNKALINICTDFVWMHDLIQEMGWEIVRQESIKNPGKRSRLWDFDDICDVLKNNKGSDAIEGIMLDMSQCRQNVCLRANTFKKMPNLRFLKLFISSKMRGRLCGLRFPAGLESFSDKLRHYEWHEYPLQSLPSNFCPEKLVTIRMPNSQFKRLWGGVQNLANLKEVHLVGCRQLMELPDFSKAQNLKSIDLSHCMSLCHVHPSILSLGTLEFLNLFDCMKLEALESEIHLRSLSNLIVHGCRSLLKFSLSSEEIENLNFEETGIRELHWPIGRSSKLKVVVLDGLSLVNLPDELSWLKSLAKLSLSNCGRVVSEQKLHAIFDGLQSLYLENSYHLLGLPNNVSRLSSLQELVLDGSRVNSLPESIMHLSSLEILSLRGCRWLQSLPELPPSIRRLNAHNCTLLQAVAFGLMTSEPQGLHKNISFHNCLNLDGQEFICSFHQYIREQAHRYELIRRGGKKKPLVSPFKICYPDRSVPEWFTYRTKGRSISFDLAPPFDRYFDSLLCVVLSEGSLQSFDIKYRCHFADGNMHKYSTGVHFLRQIPEKGGCDHVYMLYHSGRILKEIKAKGVDNSAYNPKVTFEFFVQHDKSNKVIKECGVYLINAPVFGITRMELELGMKTKRHQDILEWEHSEHEAGVLTTRDQGMLPPTKKLKEFR